jgi:mRNA-degrading endonuclease RelE of RelBE toxin-antitoxin system
LAYTPKLSAGALKYLERLDRNTARRIIDKITALSKDPYNFSLSKPLRDSNKRSARISDHRILFVVESDILLVADIEPRGQVYRAL